MLLYDKVSEADVWKYWQTLFPEVKKERDLNRILNTCERFDEKELRVFWISHKADTHEYMNWLSDHKGTFEYPEDWVNFISEDHINNIFYPLFLYKKDGIEKLSDRIYNSRIFEDGPGIKQAVMEEICLRLREVSLRTFITEIHVESAGGRLNGENPDDRFCDYVDGSWCSADYVRKFYSEYKELLELQLVIFDNTLDSSIEMIDRLEKAYPKILKIFDFGNRVLVRGIRQGLGDSHRGGRSVAEIEFTNGKKIIYKPRSLGAERGFRFYSKAVNEGLRLGEKALYETKLLDLGEYGFMEFIDQAECKTKKQTENYFYRSGILMAMLYSLNAKDIHHENLIAHGEYPVMIDLEALFHSNLEHESVKVEKSAYEIALEAIDDSVYSIGLLPSELVNPFDKDGESVDISGFGGDTEQVSPFKVLMIQNRNTDKICLAKSTYMIEPQKNVVRLGGKAVDAAEYSSFILKGFEDAYGFVENHKRELKENIGLWFDSVCTRVIYRPTYIYTRLMFTSCHPDFMREKVHRYVLMHRMAYKIKKQEEELVRSEIRDMMNGDVPFFEIDIHSGKLKNSEGAVLPLYFKKTPLDSVEEKLAVMDDADLERQKSIISHAFLSKNLRDYRDIWLTGTEWAEENNIKTDIERRDAQCLMTAEDIGDKLLYESKESYVDGKKELAWINYTPVGHDRIRYEYGVVESDLYSGTTGIGLFLLYLWKASGKEKYLEGAYGCIRPVIRRMHRIEDDSCYLTGPFNGLSGYIYVFSKFYLLTGDEEMYDAVLYGLDKMKKIYSRDTSFDIISGSAGAIKVCISLRNNFKGIIRENADELMRLLTKHLIERCTETAQGEVSWQSGINDHMYTGYAHGSSGIEEALSEVYDIYPSEDIRKVLDKSHSFMKKMYNPDRADWKTVFGKEQYSCAWCHGGPGIIYSRLKQMKRGLLKEDTGDEFTRILSHIKERALGNNICYCHGDIGNLEMIRKIAGMIGDAELSEKCKDTFRSIVPKIPEYIEKRPLLSYGFMLGISGIGYALLSAISEDVPSVLMLE